MVFRHISTEELTYAKIGLKDHHGLNDTKENARNEEAQANNNDAKVFVHVSYQTAQRKMTASKL